MNCIIVFLSLKSIHIELLIIFEELSLEKTYAISMPVTELEDTVKK